MKYKFALVDVEINLVVILKLKPNRFLILLMHGELGKEVKPKVIGQVPKYIFDSLNKILNVVINNLLVLSSL